MATSWAEVAANPAYLALPPAQKEAARKQYFDQVVAPKVPAADLDHARQQFNQASAGGRPAAQTTPAGPAASPAAPPAQPGRPNPWGPTERLAMGFITPAVGIMQGAADLAGSAEQKKSYDGMAGAFLDAKKRLQARDGKTGFDVDDTIGQALNPISYVGKGGALARAAISGGISGASQPVTGDHPIIQRAENALYGAGAGLGLGVALKGLSAAAQAIVRTVAPAMGNQNAAQQMAVARIVHRFEQDERGGGPSAAQAIAAVNEARARGTPMALADAGGKNVQGLAGSLARQPGAPKSIAEQAARSQQQQAGKRLSEIGARHISSGLTMRQSVDALTAGQKTAAAPLYEKAFNTNSTAPLIPTLQKHLADATAREQQAAKAAADASSIIAGAKPPPKVAAPTSEKLGPSLLEWISKRGGVEDKGGDIRSMGGANWHLGKPGQKRLIIDTPDAGAALPGVGKASSGFRDDKALDDTAGAAWEAGYLRDAERPDTNALLDAIGEELRGSKVHTAEDQELLRHRDENERYADFVDGHRQTARATAEDMGSTLTSSEEKHAAELIAAGEHPQSAVHQAEIASRQDRIISDQRRSQMAYQRERLTKAKATIEQAKEDRAQALDAIRQAHADVSVGKRGGIWSPRISELMSHPVMQRAVARGIHLQEVEALAEGKPFNLHDYAVAGFDKEGNPLVSKVPNMKLLDAVKRGMDDMVEEFRDPVTGRLNFMGGGARGQEARHMDTLRRSLLSEIDKVNPAYKAARAAWGGPARLKGLILEGRNIFRTHPEDVAKRVASLSPQELEAYKLGAADWWRDAIARRGPAAPEAKGMARDDFNTMIKDRLRPLFDSQKKFDDFVSAVTDERTVFVQAGKRLGGSQTAERGAEDRYEGMSAGMHVAEGATHAARGNFISAAHSIIKAKRDLGIIGDKHVNEAMARLLFSPTLDLNSPEGLKLLSSVPSPKARAYIERFRQSGAVAAGARQGQQQ
jgi:hypothetical protein